MATWSEFVRSAPDLARVGERLLWLDKPNKGGLGYLATVRADGGPRVHPVSPAIIEDRLFVFVLRKSPKRKDLLRDGRYALHSFPDASLYREKAFRDEEFFITGHATPVIDQVMRESVAKACGDSVDTGDVFELSVERAMQKRREKGVPSYNKWKDHMQARSPEDR